ncbi:MAG: zinc ribbon domain-containing protein, partial [Phycisphaerae bacterium]|nr:zinc ribbon domain-containing protein [Phycisphaerae bacterium]
ADGERWDQWNQPGAAGHGFTTVDVLASGREGALCCVQSWQKDIVSGKICRNGSGRAAYTCLPAGGDWWAHPTAVAKVAEVLAIDARNLGRMKILRMPMKMIDGKIRNVLRFDFEQDKARNIVAYELDTGILVYKAAAAEGPPSRFTKGNTIILQMWLVERRQVRTPWAGMAIHEGLAKGKTLRYEGTVTAIVPAARSELTLPVAVDVKVTAAGRTWFTYDQTSQMGALQGMPAPMPETLRLACGTSQIDTSWIPPAALRALRVGQVIDQDAKVNEKVSVKSVSDRAVVFLYEGEAGDAERAYDVTSGLMTSFRAAGGPGDLAKGAVRGRLTQGALGAPRVVDERPAPPQPAPDSRGQRPLFEPEAPAASPPPARAAKFCPACGVKAPADGKFCGQCGAKLGN